MKISQRRQLPLKKAVQDVGLSQMIDICNLNDEGKNEIYIRKSYEDDVLNRHHFDTGMDDGKSN